MKKIFFLVTISLFFTTSTKAEEAVSARVITDLNVRKQPNANSEIIKILWQNEQINSYKSKNDKWDKIILEDNSIGYVYNLYLDKNNNNKRQIIKKKKEIEIADFQYLGIVNWGGWSWTYYLMSMFPGSTSTPCPGRWINDEGFVCDPDGYIILASVDLPPYTVVETPFGYMGKIYDTGCPSGILDVYTNW